MAHIRYRCRTYYVGSFDDEIEAAKARERKAYELCCEFAYINSPEDLPALRRSCRKKHASKQKLATGRRS